MNDADVSRQIQQMVRFIRQEAEEKANEISVSAEEESNMEKLRLVEAEKKKIKQDYERKGKQENVTRIEVLQAQDDVVKAMKDSASQELVRSMLSLREPAVLLRCREIDHKLVESILDEVIKDYTDTEKAKVAAPSITIDTKVHLPPPPSNEDPHAPS
ncbi:hypothetical protein Pint_35098 [Pistacia integerrima]|uniref:Uncharacterized protein n=1 Tax=Pistacia integerrima TaxID=434235 RepID=A0ACC0Y4J9_9ROSI|nr:hypothetical protein Pint_35098 [Pistacia integerrima]